VPEVASGHEATILRGRVTVAELEATLRLGQYDCLHFMQHGKYGALQLGDGSWLSADRLALAVANQRSLRFVFINACNSASVAAALHTTVGVPVLFHEAAVDDEIAVVIAREFYSAVGQGVTLARATEIANEAGRGAAEDKTIKFTRLVLINGGERIADVVVRLEKSFDAVAEDLATINRRLARVEEGIGVISNLRPFMVVLLLLLLSLLVAQVLTPVMQVWLTP
jgi:hypothetical protein